MSEAMLIFIRSVLSFLVLLALARLMGKQQISQLTFFDYIVGITIGSIAASMSVDQNIKLMNGFIGLGIWGLIPVFISILNMKSTLLRKITQGTPTVLIKDGKVLEKGLEQEHMTLDDLMVLLRGKNIFKLADVEFAAFETDGQLSILKKAEVEPVTPKILGMMVEQETEPRLVVKDGKVMDKTLTQLGYSTEWLLTEISKKGVNRFEDIFVAQVDSTGNVYVDTYDDAYAKAMDKRKPRVKANLQRAYDDLMDFATETKDPETKKFYEIQAGKLKQALDLVDPYLKE